MKNARTAEDFDVIVVGGGAAGLSAALWCDDLQLESLLLEADAEFGGQLLWTHNRIENHLGVAAANGREMRDVFLEQMKKRRFRLKLTSEISKIDCAEKTIALTTGEIFSASSFVIATGVRRRKLAVEGEDEFAGKGIIQSGKHEQATVRGKRAAIVGGGDAAFENALILAAAAARRVFVIVRGETFRARREFVEPACAHPKIEILTETIVRKIGGGERLESLELENTKTGERYDLPADALLIRAGVEPNTRLVRGQLDLDESGYIKINGVCETNAENVFAVGDVANPLAPTVSGAVGMGATAVKAIRSRMNA